MKHKFYDVKTKKAVTTEVIECVTFKTAKRTSYAFKGKTDDGRSLTAFVMIFSTSGSILTKRRSSRSGRRRPRPMFPGLKTGDSPT